MAAKENQKATKKQSQIKRIKQTRQKLQGKGAKNGEQKGWLGAPLFSQILARHAGPRPDRF